MSHSLTQEQKRVGVDWCRYMLRKDNGNSKPAFEIVTGDESWIYQFEPELKRQSRMWVFECKTIPAKVKRSRSIGKKMITSFFPKSCSLVSVPRDTQKTATAIWYNITICLSQVFRAIEKKRPKTGLRDIQFHHRNAAALTSGIISDFLLDNLISTVDQLPYSFRTLRHAIIFIP